MNTADFDYHRGGGAAHVETINPVGQSIETIINSPRHHLDIIGISVQVYLPSLSGCKNSYCMGDFLGPDAEFYTCIGYPAFFQASTPPPSAAAL